MPAAEEARLFTAIVPPAEALEPLAALVEPLRASVPELRWAPRERWHVTLGFFGDHDDPHRRRRWLQRRARGLPAPVLRLAGGGTFRGALWAGVEAAEDDEFRRLARACGAEARRFRAHLTLARWKGHADTARATQTLGGHVGEWFTPTEVVLMRSDLGHTGPRYTRLAAVPLACDHGTA